VSGGKVATAWPIAGAAKFTEHGSGGGGVVGVSGGADELCGGGAAEDTAGALVVVGWGVLATVESPEPQPATSMAAATPNVIRADTA